MAGSARLRVLKGSVIFMGVLILVLATVLVGELLRRAFFGDTPGAQQSVAPLRMITPGLPQGAQITDMVATRNYVVIHVVLEDGVTRLFVLDPEIAAEIPVPISDPGASVSPQPLAR